MTSFKVYHKTPGNYYQLILDGMGDLDRMYLFDTLEEVGTWVRNHSGALGAIRIDQKGRRCREGFINCVIFYDMRDKHYFKAYEPGEALI